MVYSSGIPRVSGGPALPRYTDGWSHMGRIEKLLGLVDRETVLARFKGALLGCAVGEALGAPVEGMTAGEIASRHGTVTGFIDGRFGAGAVTADTQMTITLAQSMIEIGRFDLEHAAFKFGRFIEFSDNGVREARGIGLASATACRRLYQGSSPEESGVPSAGCGAAARVSPVGLFYYHDFESARRSAVAQGTLTHTDPEALAGAAAVAFMVAAGVNLSGEVDRVELLHGAAAFAASIDGAVASGIEGLSPHLDADAAGYFASTGTGGYVMDAVPGALFAFLRSPGDFEDAVLTAANAGGCAASRGAIAGAVSGAFNGAGGIPERLRNGVEGRAYLETLATKLYTLTPAAKPGRRPLL